jgi:hypothetical protein
MLLAGRRGGGGGGGGEEGVRGGTVEISGPGDPEVSTILFFVSFIIIVGWTLLQVLCVNTWSKTQRAGVFRTLCILCLGPSACCV